MKREHALKLFGLNNLAMEADLRRIAGEHNISLGRRTEKAARRGRLDGHSLRHLLLP
jgi:hypothetical protein